MSQFTGVINQMEIPLSKEEFREREHDRIWNKRLIQDVYPDLNRDQREFILTGATPEEWDSLFGDEDYEE